MFRAGDRLYGRSSPASKIQPSRDGVRWEPVPSEMGFLLKNVGFGSVDGSAAPPKLPEGPVPWAGMNLRPNR